MDLYSLENEWRAKGYAVICGTDEAGRGPLAGSVYAAAVILPVGYQLAGLNDSKKVTPKRREILYPLIQEHALAYAIGFSTVEEIAETNILDASQLAMRRAVDSLNISPDIVLVDGNIARNFVQQTACIVCGDQLCATIAAASILAKVARDHEMLALSETYPEYQFDKHKGYGTKLHYQLLRQYGPCPIHRQSFLKKYYQSLES